MVLINEVHKRFPIIKAQMNNWHRQVLGKAKTFSNFSRIQSTRRRYELPICTFESRIYSAFRKLKQMWNSKNLIFPLLLPLCPRCVHLQFDFTVQLQLLVRFIKTKSRTSFKASSVKNIIIKNMSIQTETPPRLQHKQDTIILKI